MVETGQRKGEGRFLKLSREEEKEKQKEKRKEKRGREAPENWWESRSSEVSPVPLLRDWHGPGLHNEAQVIEESEEEVEEIHEGVIDLSEFGEFKQFRGGGLRGQHLAGSKQDPASCPTRAWHPGGRVHQDNEALRDDGSGAALGNRSPSVASHCMPVLEAVRDAKSQSTDGQRSDNSLPYHRHAGLRPCRRRTRRGDPALKKPGVVLAELEVAQKESRLDQRTKGGGSVASTWDSGKGKTKSPGKTKEKGGKGEKGKGGAKSDPKKHS